MLTLQNNHFYILIVLEHRKIYYILSTHIDEVTRNNFFVRRKNILLDLSNELFKARTFTTKQEILDTIKYIYGNRLYGINLSHDKVYIEKYDKNILSMIDREEIKVSELIEKR